MEKTTILIVSDDPLARAGLAALVGEMPDCRVVAQLDSTADFYADDADVLIWDMGAATAVELPDWMEMPSPVLALLMDKSQATEAWAAGARGMLWRTCTPEMLQAAIEALAQGLMILEPAQLPYLPLSPTGFYENEFEAEPLTVREQEVLHQLATGQTNKGIAQALDISPHTVKFHVQAIMRKLDAQSRTDAVARAGRLGWLSSPGEVV